jgi:hypothetical protein
MLYCTILRCRVLRWILLVCVESPLDQGPFKKFHGLLEEESGGYEVVDKNIKALLHLKLKVFIHCV